jgi:biopolymer transport protein ExbB
MGAAPGTQPAEEGGSMNFLQLLLRGGVFMIPIGIASLFGVALIIERALALRRARIVPRHFMDDLKAAGTNRAEALAYCRVDPSPIARIMSAGLRKLPHGAAATEKAIEDAGDNELHKLRRNMRMLYGVAAVAPMMGILGTVWGLIEAFRVATAHRGLGQPELLATGIYEALVTTLAGLMVAIPVLMFYYYFSGKIEQVVVDMNDASAEFVEHFLEETTRAAPAAPVAPGGPAVDGQ